MLIPQPCPKARLAYLAGIMDGEGYFSTSIKSRSFGLRVAMTDKCVIDWLHRHFAGSMSRSSPTTMRKEVHVWTLSRQADLLWVISRMRPYLVLKVAQADAMVELVEHLQAQPAYEQPTSRSGRKERNRRRELRAQHRQRGLELRAAVVDARTRTTLF